ncbi:MAG: ferredoxin--NADP reductase [Siphonobacter sp.]
MAELIKLRIREIKTETADSKSYILETLDGLPLLYKAGQFLTLLLEHQGREVRRSYSLSSTPGIDPFPVVTIKRVTNGEISRWILNTWQVGDVIDSLAPAGRFVLPSEGSNDLFLFAAGSGITPVFSLLKSLLREQPKRRILLFYSNTNLAGTIFKAELDQLVHQYSNHLTIEYIWSNPPEPFPHRRLNNMLVERLVFQYYQPDHGIPDFYLCGPEDYMRMVRIVLLFLGFPAEAIRKENFVIDVTPPAIPEGFGVDAEVEIQYHGKRHKIHVEAGMYILTAALRAGISLPFSCRGGRCSTCVAHCVKGKVKMTINDVLTEREMAEGEMLTCTALAETDKVIIQL